MSYLGGEVRGDQQYLTCWYDIHGAVVTEDLARCIILKALERAYRNEIQGTGMRS